MGRKREEATDENARMKVFEEYQAKCQVILRTHCEGIKKNLEELTDKNLVLRQNTSKDRVVNIFDTGDDDKVPNLRIVLIVAMDILFFIMSFGFIVRGPDVEQTVMEGLGV